ncbi:MAG: Rid family detoxifying hydrolase [Alphaproteobacteria bacterium]|nr:Rid family detoxifying hydrolase [Alphaproteobacteria bacterium]
MPPALGPYSQGVQAGNLLFVSGQVGLDPETGELAGSDFEAQARQAFVNMRAVLAAASCGMDDVVKTTCWVADADAFQTFNDLYGEFFPNDPPARSTPIVALPKGLLYSMECIAVVPS